MDSYETSPLQIMQADLPNMPADVIDSWLRTFYDRFGWPPTKYSEWRYVLGLGNDLSFLQGLTWQLQVISISPEMFTLEGRHMLVSLFETYVLKRSTIYSDLSDGPERFRSACDYIKTHKRFPRPVALMDTPDGYRILDGCHRLTAFLYLYGWFNIQNDETHDPALLAEQSVWVAS